MSNRKEIRLGLRHECAQLNHCIDELRHQVATSDGAIQLYRQTRLDRALESKERLTDRMRMLVRTKGEQRWNDAERLWSDLRNAVLGITAPA